MFLGLQPYVEISLEFYKLSLAGGPHELCSCILQSLLKNKVSILRRFKIALLVLFLLPLQLRSARMFLSLDTCRKFVGCHHWTLLLNASVECQTVELGSAPDTLVLFQGAQCFGPRDGNERLLLSVFLQPWLHGRLPSFCCKTVRSELWNIWASCQGRGRYPRAWELHS